MSALNAVSVAGFFGLLVIAWLAGGAKRPLPWRTLVGGGVLSFGLGTVVFLLPAARTALVWINNVLLALLTASSRGTEFLLGPLAVGPGQVTAGGEASVGVILATQVLPAVIFFSSAMALLNHIGLIQPIILAFAKVFHRVLNLSGAEALVGALHLFFGVESVTAVKPYLAKMTRSELLGALSTNLATVASTILAVYVLFLRETFPQIAGHLLSASLLSIPCAIMASKLVLPEQEVPVTLGSVPPLAAEDRHENAIAAISSGAVDGLKVAASIGAILIAVLGMVGVADAFLATSAGWFGQSGWSLSGILGFFFYPFAYLLGIETADLAHASRLLGQRLVTTEVVSYQELGVLAANESISNRSLLVLSYALCGFAHVAGVGIALGGFSALAPSRLNDLAGLALRCLFVATLATLMTGCIAGAFYYGQEGLL